MKKKTTEDFKNDVKLKYKDEYTVIGEYINNKTPIKVLHNSCNNIITVRPDVFLNNYKIGCSFCNSKKLKTTEIFKEEVFSKFGDEYSVLGTYINSDTKIKVRHNVCGNEYFVLPYRLLAGDRCFKCFGNKKKTIADIKNELFKIHGDSIELLSTTCINNKSELLFMCNACKRTFYSTANRVLSLKTGCPHCNKSKGEHIISTILENQNISFNSEVTFPDLFIKGKKRKTYLRFDFKINIDFPGLTKNYILLEFDGEQHFHPCGKFNKDFEKIKNYDKLKNEYCLKNDITLIRIPFTHFKQLFSIINNLISSTTIPDEFKVVDSNGSKHSALLYKLYNNGDIV